MNERSLLKVGIIGTTVAALCCFTQALRVLLGRSAWPRQSAG